MEERGHRVVVLSKAEQLPLEVRVDRPDAVGIDRLLNAVAAKKRLAAIEVVAPVPVGRRRGPRAAKRKHPVVHSPAVLVDAGSAITVDLLDENHVFRGGSIFPGLRLMGQALHDYTALLPLVEVREPVPALPATDTASAIQAGIYHAAAGGIERIAWRLSDRVERIPFSVFITGGDAALLHSGMKWPPAILWPTQTLEGILASAEALP